MEIEDEIRLDKNRKHTIEIVVDRLIIRKGIQKRLTDSIESALNLAGGLLIIDVMGKEELLFSQNYACPDCGISIEELTPRMFSFNNPYGACPDCDGLGMLLRIDPDLVIPDRTKSMAEGAIASGGFNFTNGDSYGRMYLDAMAKHYGFSVDTPVKDLPEKTLNKILYGTGKEKIRVEYDRGYGKESFMSTFEGLSTAWKGVTGRPNPIP